jgi:uncharacterized phage protein (TIGR02218 family)
MNNLYYCFHIKFSNNREIFLTDYGNNVYHNNILFLANSGLYIKYCEFNDSAQNHIILNGIFEKNGIEEDNDLRDAEIGIFIYSNKNLTNFTTYYCESFTYHDLSFEIKLSSIANLYNQPLLQVFSKTCRANFCDDKCQIIEEDYSNIYEIQKIDGNIVIVTSMDKENGYYNGGVAIINDNKFQILHHTNNILSLSGTVTSDIFIKLIAGCDKNFETCCDKFNNAINFRGEPLTPDDSFIKT